MLKLVQNVVEQVKQATASCKSCHGTGYDEVKDSFKVDIPEGVNDGMRIRVLIKEILHLMVQEEIYTYK